jgi:N-methylhydantoinase A
MIAEGDVMLEEEGIPAERREAHVKFDCRYLKQFHEVSFVVAQDALRAGDGDAIAAAFHAEHNRLYGYSLEDTGENVPVEIINVRVQAVGITEKPEIASSDRVDADPSGAEKGTRAMYIPEYNEFRDTKVYDGHKLQHGNRLTGPAMVEQVTTAIFVSADYDCVVDIYGSFVLYRKGREDLVTKTLEGGS